MYERREAGKRSKYPPQLVYTVGTGREGLEGSNSRCLSRQVLTSQNSWLWCETELVAAIPLWYRPTSEMTWRMLLRKPDVTASCLVSLFTPQMHNFIRERKASIMHFSQKAGEGHSRKGFSLVKNTKCQKPCQENPGFCTMQTALFPMAKASKTIREACHNILNRQTTLHRCFTPN